MAGKGREEAERSTDSSLRAWVHRRRMILTLPFMMLESQQLPAALEFSVQQARSELCAASSKQLLPAVPTNSLRTLLRPALTSDSAVQLAGGPAAGHRS